MRRLIVCILIGSLVSILHGCSAVQPSDQKEETSLDLMEKVNDSDIVNNDELCRLWYQVETSYFADGDGDGTGDLTGLMNYLDYISDGDITTDDDDLNMTGIYLNELLQTDNLEAIVDYYSIDQRYGDTAALARLCEQASARGIAVMIPIDIAYISKDSTYFTHLIESAEALGKDDTLEDLNDPYKGMFYLSEEEKDGYIPLGNSYFYYLPSDDGQTPWVRQDDPAWQMLLSSALDYYMDLGVTGFYFQNLDPAFTDSSAKKSDFLLWLHRTVHAKDPNATLVVSSNSFDSTLSGSQVYIAQKPFSGAEGYISKAVTGAITARDLADHLNEQNSSAAYYLTTSQSNMDLIKSLNRQEELKMALALLIMRPGQVFISAGDEIGLADEEVSMIADALQETDQEQGEQLELTFGSLEDQKKDGNSVLNFLQQAILLRDRWNAISQGDTWMLDDLITDQVIAWRSRAGDSDVAMVFNLSDEAQEVDVSGIQIHDLPAELGGILLTDNDATITLENGVLTLPGHSMAVLK